MQEKTIPVDERLEELLVYAIRYALTRRPYDARAISSYITPLVPYISESGLIQMRSDILTQSEFGEYGHKWCEKLWLGLAASITKELERRGQND